MPSSKELLEQFLTARSLHECVIGHVTRELGCESISDFAGYWVEVGDTFSEDVIAHLHATLDERARRIQLSRLRIAWQNANGEVRKEPTEDPVDLEAPLTNSEAVIQKQGWQDVGIRFAPEATPGQHLVSRAFREFTKKHRSLDELTKMRSTTNTPAIPPETRKKMGEVSIVFNSRKLPDLKLDGILQVLRAEGRIAFAQLLHEAGCNQG